MKIPTLALAGGSAFVLTFTGLLATPAIGAFRAVPAPTLPKSVTLPGESAPMATNPVVTAFAITTGSDIQTSDMAGAYFDYTTVGTSVPVTLMLIKLTFTGASFWTDTSGRKESAGWHSRFVTANQIKTTSSVYDYVWARIYQVAEVRGVWVNTDTTVGTPSGP